MANTTNFNWETPDDTDLVKDGAAAIRTLGSAIDTSLVDLKGGTTGQVLSKATNTDMDFTWVAQDDSNAIQNTLLTTTGDTIYASAASTPARLGIGSSGQCLTVVAGVPSWAASPTSVLTTTGDLLYASAANTLARRAVGSTGDVLTVAGGVPTWATPSGSNANFTLVNTGGTALSGSSTVSISGITNANQLLIIVDTATMGSSGNAMDFFINGDTASNYYGTYFNVTSTATYNPAAFQSYSLQGTPPRVGEQSNNASSGISMSAYITGGNSSGQKVFTIVGGANGYGGTGQYSKIQMGRYNSSSTISSITITSVSAQWTGGTIYVYKSA